MDVSPLSVASGQKNSANTTFLAAESAFKILLCWEATVTRCKVPPLKWGGFSPFAKGTNPIIKTLKIKK